MTAIAFLGALVAILVADSWYLGRARGRGQKIGAVILAMFGTLVAAGLVFGLARAV